MDLSVLFTCPKAPETCKQVDIKDHSIWLEETAEGEMDIKSQLACPTCGTYMKPIRVCFRPVKEVPDKETPVDLTEGNSPNDGYEIKTPIGELSGDEEKKSSPESPEPGEQEGSDEDKESVSPSVGAA